MVFMAVVGHMGFMVPALLMVFGASLNIWGLGVKVLLTAFMAIVPII